MIIEKETSEVHVSIKIKKCDSFLCRLVGLMFQIKPIQKTGIWLIPCNSIHMFFMFFPIDVVFLDREQTVVRAYKNVRPWSVIPPVPFAYSTLELPVGIVNTYKIKSGDKIRF